MCLFQYHWYGKCNHFGIELAEYCPKSRYLAGLRGVLHTCDHAFNNVEVSRKMAQNSNTLIFYPEISADFDQIWGYCKRCKANVEPGDHFPQPGAAKIHFPPRNLIWCRGQYFSRTWPPYVYLPSLTATLPELFSINANITMLEGIHHPAVPSLFFPRRAYFIRSWPELLARNMRNYGMWVNCTMWDDHCDWVRATWPRNTLDEAMLGWYGPARAFGFNKLKLAEAHQILNIRGGLSRYDAELMGAQAHAGIPTDITFNIFRGRGIPLSVYNILYKLASQGDWRCDQMTGSLYTARTLGWRPARSLPPPAHSQGHNGGSHDGHNGQGNIGGGHIGHNGQGHNGGGYIGHNNQGHIGGGHIGHNGQGHNGGGHIVHNSRGHNGGGHIEHNGQANNGGGHIGHIGGGHIGGGHIGGGHIGHNGQGHIGGRHIGQNGHGHIGGGHIGHNGQGHNGGVHIIHDGQGHIGGGHIGHNGQGHNGGGHIVHNGQGNNGGGHTGHNGQGNNGGGHMGHNGQGYNGGGHVGHNGQGYNGGGHIGHNGQGHNGGGHIGHNGQGHNGQGYNGGGHMGHNGQGH